MPTIMAPAATSAAAAALTATAATSRPHPLTSVLACNVLGGTNEQLWQLLDEPLLQG